MNNKKRGFTLIELLVVIAILGLLTAIVLVSLTRARSRAKDSRVTEDVLQIRNLSQIYYNDNLSFLGFENVAVNAELKTVSDDIISMGSGLEVNVGEGGRTFCAFAPLVSDPAVKVCTDGNLNLKQYSSLSYCSSSCVALDNCVCE